ALGTSLSTPQVPYGESAERSTPHRNLVKGWGRRRGANDAGLRTDEDRRAELEQRLEVSERPLRNANAARRDAPADRRRIVRAVDRELVAARPSRGQARLDAADPERERSEWAPRTERDAIGHHVVTGRRRGPRGPGRTRHVVPDHSVLIHAGGVLGTVDRNEHAGRNALQAAERDPPVGPRPHVGKLDLAPRAVRARVF